MSNPIRRAIDYNLVSLRVTDRDVDRIMERIRQGEQPRARRLRLRYALVVAILLALVTVSGTAAMLLTPREIINDGVLIMAGESENGLWLNESQVRKVLALARSNDIDLTANSLSHVNDALEEFGGYWTEDLIWDIMSARYGTWNEWPQEEVNWFNATIESLHDAYAEGRERDPIAGELSYEEALMRAKVFVKEVYPTAPLDDESCYDVDVEFFDGLSIGYYPGYYWSVNFSRKNVSVPYIMLEFSADGKQLYNFDSWGGVDSAQDDSELWWAFFEIYGDMSTWTQKTWRAFIDAMKQAEANGLKIGQDDYRFIMQTEYPDIAPEAMPAEEAKMIALKAVKLYDDPNAWVESCVYMGDEPNPIWKVTIREHRNIEGYADEWNYYVEVDSVTAQVKVIDESAAIYSHRYMYTLHSIYGSTTPDIPEEAYPAVSAEKARMNTMAYLQERYGDTRDFNDPELFDVMVKEELGFSWENVQWLVIVDATQVGEVGYWAYVDGYGNVLDAGVDNGAITSGRSLDSIRFEQDRVVGYFDSGTLEDGPFMTEVRNNADQNDPVVQLLCKTHVLNSNAYMNDNPVRWEMRQKAMRAAEKAVGYRNLRIDWGNVYSSDVLLGVDRANGVQEQVWKFAVRSEKGDYLIEVSNETFEVISAIEVKNILDPWYATFLLQSDMEAAGIAPQPYTQPANNGLVVNEGIVRGMQLRHIFWRFYALYGSDMFGWSQAQLQSFQAAVSESSSIGGDLGAVCMQDTRYPSVPAEAISREAAAESGAQAMGLTDYEVIGSVLIADAPNAVWKVCYRIGDNYCYAEVDCITGEVKTTAQRNEEEYWFQDMILERIIHEHEETFHSISFG